jgi:hypothetical protein
MLTLLLEGRKEKSAALKNQNKAAPKRAQRVWGLGCLAAFDFKAFEI